jgi:broad specificity phosphatase PhoE
MECPGAFLGSLGFTSDAARTGAGRARGTHSGRVCRSRHIHGGEPLGRARETALLLRRHFSGAEPVLEPRQREISLGSWDGLDTVEIHAEWPRALERATPLDWYFRSPDGESYEEATARLDAWLDERAAPVVAVSHGLAGRLLRGLYLGLPREEALALPVPQDAIFKLAGGTIETLTLPAPAVEHA